MDKKTIIIWGIFLLSLVVVSYATEATGMFLTSSSEMNLNLNGNYLPGAKLVTSGSGKNYILDMSLTHPIVKDSVSVATNIYNKQYDLCLGMLCYYREPIYSLNVNGELKYQDGTVVQAGSKLTAKLMVDDTVIQTTTAKVLDNGEFVIDINDLDDILNKDFHVELYVEGQVEAVYECVHETAEDEDGNEIHVCKKWGD